jgi:hypothetical protein
MLRIPGMGEALPTRVSLLLSPWAPSGMYSQAQGPPQVTLLPA